jgi:hypothetical protein
MTATLHTLPVRSEYAANEALALVSLSLWDVHQRTHGHPALMPSTCNRKPATMPKRSALQWLRLPVILTRGDVLAIVTASAAIGAFLALVL